jgi:lipopolysaccharide transport system ATP-binding protein
VRFTFHATGTVPDMACSFTIYDQLGQAVTYFDSALHSPEDTASPGRPMFVCELDRLMLVPGHYRINAAITSSGELLDHIEGAAVLEVHTGTAAGRVVKGVMGFGSIFMEHRWVRPC